MLKLKTLQLEVTNDCNLNCSICMRVNSKRKVGYLNFKEFTNLPVLEFKEVAFHGWGEPLLHPDLFKFIKFTSSEGIETSLITNGTILDKNIDEILKSDLSSIAFGIFTTKGKELVFENIKKFSRKNNQIPAYIDITILPWNLSEIEKIVKFAAECNLNGVVLHKLFHLHNPNLKPLSEDYIKNVCRTAKKIGKEYGIKVYCPPKKSRPCAVARSCIFAGWDLIISPCCFLHEMGYHYTSLNFEEHKNFLKRMKENDVCKRCPW